ncbi:MAG: GIY-YIG nuclease family protein [Clostridiales bacterium]|nr:GIY-YIG nuclease family protein [Clostridiales bacterium]
MIKSRKEMAAEYKGKLTTGGVYAIKNTKNDKLLLDCTTDIVSMKNRFEFIKKTDTVFSMKLQEDWKKYGKEVFEFVIIEEIEQNEKQTKIEYKKDVELLKEIWVENMKENELY